MYISLVVILIRTGSTRLTINDYFGEIINELQDCSIKKKTLGLLQE